MGILVSEKALPGASRVPAVCARNALTDHFAAHRWRHPCICRKGEIELGEVRAGEGWSLDSSLGQPPSLSHVLKNQQQMGKDLKHCWNPWDLLGQVGKSIKESHFVYYRFATCHLSVQC